MQYTRVYLNAAKEIIHIFTSETPIEYDHVEADDITESYDMEVGDDDLPFTRARVLLNNMEVKAGLPAFKADAPAELTATKVNKKEVE